MKTEKFFIEILGCPMRAIEAQRLTDYFITNNLESANMAEADIVVVFTCSVVDDTENRTLSFIDALDKEAKRVILLGCSPGMSPQKFSERFSIEMLATKDLESKIDSLFPDFKTKFEEIPLPTDFQKEYNYGEYYLNQFLKYEKKSIFSKHKKTPALIISSKGCNNNCSYCTMKRALGPVKSYPLEVIGDNYRKLKKKGHHVFVFNADDTGAYGIDIGKTFADLLDYCDKIDQEFNNKSTTWIIDNLHPMWALKYEVALNRYIQKGKISEMIIPLQAGSDRLLTLMKRKYQIEDIKQCLNKFKSNNKKLLIKTHFIIGFPNEELSDIESIRDIINEKYFGHYIFLKYFEAEDSNSAQIFPKISDEKVYERIDYLEKIMKENNTEYLIDGIISKC